MPDEIQMPRYQSIKKVWALQIATVEPDMSAQPDGAGWSGLADHYMLTFSDSAYAPRRVEGKIFTRYMAQPGDYYVQYEDGYESISPAKAFEEGYVPC